MRQQTKALALAAVFSVGAVAGCATTYDERLDQKVSTTADAAALERAAALVAEGDALWKERLDADKLKACLAKWEEAARLAPSVDVLTKLARGHYLLGDAHHALADNAEARDSEYQIGLDWATEALKVAAPEYVAAKAGGAKHVDAIKLVPKEGVASMYWFASNLGKWAASKGFATRLKYKDDLKATMDHVRSLEGEPLFFYAATWRYFGGYEAATAGIAGGSLDKSKENFDRAIAIAPQYLGNKVLVAEFLAPKLQKDVDGDGVADGKALFERMLNEVISADPAADPEIEPENRLEQQKAKKLLAKIDELF